MAAPFLTSAWNSLASVFDPQRLLNPTQADANDLSARWVWVQFLVGLAFYRLATPLLVSNRWYWKPRTVVDIWLFCAMFMHTPMMLQSKLDMPTRWFVSALVFFFCVLSGLGTLSLSALHLVSWRLSPRLVYRMSLPSSPTWRRTSITSLVKFALIISFSFSFLFVGCVIDALNPQVKELPWVCRVNLLSTPPSKDGIKKLVTESTTTGFNLTSLSTMVSPIDVSPLSLFGEGALGLIWIPILCAILLRLVIRRSARMSDDARLLAALSLQDIKLQTEALIRLAKEGNSRAFHYLPPEVFDQQQQHEATSPAPRSRAMTGGSVTTTPGASPARPASAPLVGNNHNNTTPSMATKTLNGGGGGGQATQKVMVTPHQAAKAAVEDALENADQPVHLPMCEWYAISAANAGFNLLISFRLFFGRYDIRSAVVRDMFKAREPKGDLIPVVDESAYARSMAPNGDVWFDWLADTGDGGDATYEVARWCARPVIYVKRTSLTTDFDAGNSLLGNVPVGDLALPRPNLLIIGGDLVYPDPSVEAYNARLFRPFEDALEPPMSYRAEAVSERLWSSTGPGDRLEEFQKANFPLMYTIPGNHDCLDGNFAYTRCFLDRDFCGGWRMPQKNTYWALRLGMGWWIFGLDQGIAEDIDVGQFRYFTSVFKTHVKEGDSIIIAAHEPLYLYDAYRAGGVEKHPHRGPIHRELIRVLGKSVVLRVCGDLHTYLRHEKIQQEGASTPDHLVVSGGGGAFQHANHSFPETFWEMGSLYRRARAYPDVAKSRLLGLENLTTFRIHNWRFDIFGATMYFFLVASMFPRCGVSLRVTSGDPFTFVGELLVELASLLFDVFVFGRLSLVTMLAVIAATFGLAESEKGGAFRLKLAIFHASMHIAVAGTLFLLLEWGLEMAIRDGLAGVSYDRLFKTVIGDGVGGPRIVIACLRLLLRVFDIPETVAVTRVALCSASSVTVGLQALSRFEYISYFFGVFLLLYIVVTDLVSLVLGLYLAISGSVFDVHWNEAFSSLRNPHCKHFIRFKIDAKTQDMHCFVMGIDHVPSRWMKNPLWSSVRSRFERYGGMKKETDPQVASFGSVSPHKWIPAVRGEGRPPRLVDYFVVKKRRAGENGGNGEDHGMMSGSDE